MQWLDTEQSDFDKSYIEGEARDARERWFRMVEWEKREEKKEEQKEMRHRQEMREREAAQAREADRERGRGSGLTGPRKLSRMPSGRGNTPVVLNRPRVLIELYQIISDFMTSSTRVLGLYP
jgi:FtsZ-interacting cell division protein YlmF